jgi:pheromone shutdown protein TraB
MAHPPGVDVDADPRVTGEYLRQVPGDSGTLTLVGVVHDHPASTYRTRQVITELDPSVVALELPPISIPLFEEYADSGRTPPVFGGEMSAAIQAASPDTAVGIDRPTGGFFRRLGRTLLRERPTAETLRNVFSNTVSTTKHALLCRIAAVLAAHTSVRLEVDSPTPHDIDWTDTPEEQASDEREQVRRSRSFMNAFRTTNRSRASQIEDAAREADMATRLSALREREDVVAVVGIDHLDSLTERLDTGTNAV